MALKRRKGLKRTPLKRRTTKQKKVRKLKPFYKPPDWFTKIKLGSHGNNPYQKRYWRVVSCLVRQRDEQYGCVSCPTKYKKWSDYDAAHFKRYAVCNSYFKFDPLNIAASCKACNRNDDGVVGHAFGEELKRRYGNDHLVWIEEENKHYKGKKMENHEIVTRVEQLLKDNQWFDITTTH